MSNIGSLLERKKVSIREFRGRKIAIDALNAIYQFLALIRMPLGFPLTDGEGRITSHLNGLLFRTIRLLEEGITPVYVFDGEPPKLKREELESRREMREKAFREWVEAVAAGDYVKAWAKAVRSARVTSDIIESSKKLLSLMGVPWVQAPCEGEAQAAFMASTGSVWASASQDSDSLLFGSPILVRNLTITGKKLLRKTGEFVKLIPEIINLRENLERLKITREQLVDIAILIGTDYNKGVKGVGPKKAYKLIVRYGCAEKAYRALGVKPPKNIEEVRRHFLEPLVTREYSVEVGQPDFNGLKEFLVEEKGFNKRRVEAAIKRLRAAVNTSSLTRWLDEASV